MRDSRILSSFQDLSSTMGALPLSQMPEHRRDVELVYDTCQLGVVLRVVLFVQAIAWVAALYGAQSVVGWLETLAVLTAATLPSVLIWLLLTCALKRQLARLPMPAQWTLGILLGAAAAATFAGQAAAQAAAPELPRGLLLDTLWDGWLDVARSLECVAIVCNHALWDTALVATAREHGLRTLAYTVNDDWAARRLLDLGLDGIITDRVDLFAPGA